MGQRLRQQLWASGNPYIAIAAGVLTHGHASPGALDGILEVTRDDGIILFSLSQSAFDEMGFEQKIAELDAAGRWRKLEQSNLFRSYPFSAKDAHLHHWVLAYQKCGGAMA